MTVTVLEYVFPKISIHVPPSTLITTLILQAEKFLKCDWLRPVVFHPNLKYLHVKITVSMVHNRNDIVCKFETMAERFPYCDPKQLQELKENAENTNTKKSTKTWLTVWTTWAEEKGYSPDIVSYEAKELDEKLQKFFAEVRKKDGSDYEPDSLRVMLASLDRHLKEAGSNISIAKDREFVDSRKVLEGKARYLREQGYGKCPHVLKALTTEDEELLWSKGLLGNQSPKSLIAMMWVFLRNILDYEAARNTTTYLWKILHSVKTSMASSTSRTKKIPQKLARADFARNEEWFSRKCLQLMGQDVQSSY